MGLDWIINKIFSTQEVGMLWIALSEDKKENNSRELHRAEGQVLSDRYDPAVWITEYPYLDISWKISYQE